MLHPVGKLAKDAKTSERIQGESAIEQKVTEQTDFVDNTRSVIINEGRPLARCSVLYLGTAVPSEDQRGIDSIQEPISKRYPVDGSEVVRGIEAWLSVDENGVQIQFVSDPSVVLYYPIRSLAYCASIRFATRMETGEQFPNGWRFVSLDSPDAALPENSQNPPLFALSVHRTREFPMDECHCFMMKTKPIALSLVEACSKAYRDTNPEQDCSKVPLYFKIVNGSAELKEIDDEISIVRASDKESISDYQVNSKATGFFYKTEQVPIDSWQLGENPKRSLRRSSSSTSSHTSHHRKPPRRFSSIASIPKTDQIPEPSITNNSSTPSPALLNDPYTSDPNVIRVERITDAQTGREVYIRWLKNSIAQVPKTLLPIYDFIPNQLSEQNLSDQIQRFALDDQPPPPPPPPPPKKSKKKKHSKSRKKHRHEYTEFIHSYIPPPSFTPTFPYIQSSSPHPPFQFYSM